MTPAGPWAARSVLVTGATGLIGAWLTEELLARGARVTALVLDEDPRSHFARSGAARRVRSSPGALEDLAAVERAIDAAEADTVFHLGAQTQVIAARRDPLGTFEANVRGTYNLLEACRRRADAVKRVLVASSDKAYGDRGSAAYTEADPLDGKNPYEVSKVCTDALARSYHHSFGLPVAVARLGNVYGGGDLNWARLVPGAARAFLRGERFVVRSDGKLVRDYLYVKDAAAAYLALSDGLDKGVAAGQAFNFAADQPRTVLEMVEAVRRAMKVEGLPLDVRNEAVGEIPEQRLSWERAKKDLGWRPAWTLEPALAETAAWYKGLHAEGVL